MTDTFEDLQKITQLTLSELSQNTVILPSLYLKKFLSNSKKFNESYSIENINSLLEQDFEKLRELLSNLLDKTVEETEVILENIEKENWDLVKESKKSLKELQKEIENLQQQLYTDTLTGLFNIKWYKEKFLKDGEFQKSGSLVFIDINNFKHINDTFGHIVGDAVLRFFSSFFNKERQAFIEKYNNTFDIVRYAGDEFLILLDTEDLIFVEEEIKKMQLFLKKKSIVIKDKDKINISFSYGVMSFKPGDSVEEVINKSDQKMYLNKMKEKKRYLI